MNRNDVKLAELIFHELSHPRVFFSGDTDFNEAFATANSQEAVHRWLKSKHQTQALAEYDEELKHDVEFSDLVFRTRKKLEALYAQKSFSAEELRIKKQQIFADMRKEYESLKRTWHGDITHDVWFTKPINNARLNAVASYYDLVPGFMSLLDQCGGNLEKFYEAAESLKGLSKEERRKKLPQSRSGWGS